MWSGKKLSLSFIKLWGCEAFVKRLQSDKLTPKSDKCILVGYPRETLGYYFYNREEGKVFVASNGVFLEKEFLSREVSGSTVHSKKFVMCGSGESWQQPWRLSQSWYLSRQ
jgi:hypothetical protein